MPNETRMALIVLFSFRRTKTLPRILSTFPLCVRRYFAALMLESCSMLQACLVSTVPVHRLTLACLGLHVLSFSSYGDDAADQAGAATASSADAKPKILLMGLRRYGISLPSFSSPLFPVLVPFIAQFFPNLYCLSALDAGSFLRSLRIPFIHPVHLSLLDTPRSGKSSIQKVVFHKMSPNETLFLESTSKIIKDGEPRPSFTLLSCPTLPSLHLVTWFG